MRGSPPGFGAPARWTWVGGKGGVGKTTVAAALALTAAERGEEVLVVSVDPAHSLRDALGLTLGPDPAPMPGLPHLHAMELDAERERDRFLRRNRDALAGLLERGSYLAPEEADSLLALELPGLDEVAATLRLAALLDAPFERVVVDTAPTGHALRLLSTPELLRRWTGALAALGERHRAVADAFAPPAAPLPDDPLLPHLERELARFAARLADPARTRVVLVTTPEPVVSAETTRFRAALRAAGIALGGVVVNRARPGPPPPLEPPPPAGSPTWYVPLLRDEPRGVAGLRCFVDALRATPPPADAAGEPASAGAGSLEPRGPLHPPAGRALYLVAGKGGVGKTTVASAVALRLVDGGAARVLLLSVDPAGSLGEVWGTEVGGEATPAPDEPRLHLRQLDAGSLWTELRGEVGAEAEATLRGLLAPAAGEGDDAAARLLALVPPGIDELAALVGLVDLLESDAYNAVVLDTAPTGHLLRLLEMPHLALGWIHATMRLLLRYREAVGLGPFAERLLRTSRGLRSLERRLRDGRHSWTAVVTLAEQLSVVESARLAARLGALGMRPDVVLVNRLSPARAVGAAPLDEIFRIPAGRVGSAPEMPVGPRGARELRAFADGWRIAGPGAGSPA